MCDCKFRSTGVLKTCLRITKLVPKCHENTMKCKRHNSVAFAIPYKSVFFKRKGNLHFLTLFSFGSGKFFCILSVSLLPVSKLHLNVTVKRQASFFIKIINVSNLAFYVVQLHSVDCHTVSLSFPYLIAQHKSQKHTDEPLNEINV